MAGQGAGKLYPSRAGFFRLDHAGGKWRLLDPHGRPIYLRGMNHYGDGSFMPWNLAARYGGVDVWRRSVRDRHREWGFNFLPPSIGPSAVDPATIPCAAAGSPAGALTRRTPEWPTAHFAELDFPFTFLLEVPRQNMYPGPPYPDVFSAEFREAVERGLWRPRRNSIRAEVIGDG